MNKHILAGFLSVCLFIQCVIVSFAETVSVSIIEKPNIDVLLTIGNYDTDLTNFEQDIRTSL